MPVKKVGKIPDISKLSDKLKSELPLIIANKAKNHYIEGFRRGGGMTDKSAGGWEPRKKPYDRKAYGKKDYTKRAILVLAGHLRSDVDIRKTTFKEIIIGTTDTIYASVHNNGEKAGRGKGFIMPKREFLGKSRSLEAKINTLIKKKMKQTYG